MFATLIDTLRDKGRGVHAYRSVADAALARARTEPATAAAWQLLAALAEDFLERYERMPLSSAELEAAFTRFAGHAEAFDAAAATPAAMLAALNAAAQDVALGRAEGAA